MTVIDRFADFITTMKPPIEARSAARRCLLDWYGAAIAGAAEAPASLLRRALPMSGNAALIPDGQGTDARTAALINGTASHTVEVDDIYRSGLYHPGVVTIPAALALCETESASGVDLLDAIIAGYEVSNRIARAVNPAHYALWHTTATVGHFAAAAAGARALHLDAARTAHALATTATFAAGLRHAFSSDAMSKPLHAGRAAEGGVLAALIAREGVTGVDDMLEGERGFGKAMSSDVDWEAAVSTLASEWTITETTPKAHACCGHNFAALDAVAILMTEHQIDPSSIASIAVESYRAAVEICGNANPVSAAEARFSLPWCVASMALSSAVTPQCFTDEALGAAATRAMAAKVQVSLDDEAEARFPHARTARVRIALNDGSSLTHHRHTRKGDPDDPMSDHDITEKFLALSTPIVGVDRAQALVSRIAEIENISDVRTIRSAARA